MDSNVVSCFCIRPQISFCICNNLIFIGIYWSLVDVEDGDILISRRGWWWWWWWCLPVITVLKLTVTWTWTAAVFLIDRIQNLCVFRAEFCEQFWTVCIYWLLCIFMFWMLTYLASKSAAKRVKCCVDCWLKTVLFTVKFFFISVELWQSGSKEEGRNVLICTPPHKFWAARKFPCCQIIFVQTMQSLNLKLFPLLADN